MELAAASNLMPHADHIARAEEFLLPTPKAYLHKPISSEILHLPLPPAREPSKNLVIRGLSARVQQAFEPFLKPVLLTKQQTLYREDDRLDFVYFPCTSIVSEFRMLEDGRFVEVATTGRDGAVGLASLLLGSKLPANTTQVSQPGTAERIPVWALTTLLGSHEELRESLNPFAARYMRQISQKVICNMYHPAKERLCTWLLAADDWRCSETLMLTHEQMAGILGVFRPTVTFIAQQLRKSNLIDYSRGEISICDRRRLRQSACACYSAMRQMI